VRARRICRHLRHILLAVLIVPSAAPAFAQTPAPPPPAPAPPPPPPRKEGSGEIAFVNTAGNAESTSLGVRGEFIYRPDPWLLKMRGAFVRLESEDELEAQSFTWLLRGERSLRPRLSMYAQHDYLRDLFAGIEHKNVVSGGLSFKAIETARHTLVLDGGLGVSSEKRVVDDDVTSAVVLGGVAYKLKISETTELTEELRFEQSLNEGSDSRLDNAVALAAKINAIFSLKVSNVIRYVNEPVEGFETTDTITSVALVAKF